MRLFNKQEIKKRFLFVVLINYDIIFVDSSNMEKLKLTKVWDKIFEKSSLVD